MHTIASCTASYTYVYRAALAPPLAETRQRALRDRLFLAVRKSVTHI
jgi:hypothetical protein